MRLPIRFHGLSLIALLALVAACASRGSGSSEPQASCELRQTDLPFAQAGPVFRDCAVDRKVRQVTRGVSADFRPDRLGCYSATVEFVVDTLGFPEIGTARIVRSTDPTFAQSVLATLSRLKYEPARRGGFLVRQITTVESKTALVVATGGTTPNMRAPAC